MKPDEINQVLTTMDDLQETMSYRSLKVSQSSRARDASANLIANARKGAIKNKRPCTVDGITIYESKGALEDALGFGKEGRHHPNFRFINGPGSTHENRKPMPPEHKASIGRGQIGREGAGGKPCTIDDGVTVFKNLLALSRALGFGKAGKANPNLRLLTPEEIEKWKEENGT